MDILPPPPYSNPTSSDLPDSNSPQPPTAQPLPSLLRVVIQLPSAQSLGFTSVPTTLTLAKLRQRLAEDRLPLPSTYEFVLGTSIDGVSSWVPVSTVQEREITVAAYFDMVVEGGGRSAKVVVVQPISWDTSPFHLEVDPGGSSSGSAGPSNQEEWEMNEKKPGSSDTRPKPRPSMAPLVSTPVMVESVGWQRLLGAHSSRMTLRVADEVPRRPRSVPFIIILNHLALPHRWVSFAIYTMGIFQGLVQGMVRCMELVVILPIIIFGLFNILFTLYKLLQIRYLPSDEPDGICENCCFQSQISRHGDVNMRPLGGWFGTIYSVLFCVGFVVACIGFVWFQMGHQYFLCADTHFW